MSTFQEFLSKEGKGDEGEEIQSLLQSQDNASQHHQGGNSDVIQERNSDVPLSPVNDDITHNSITTDETRINAQEDTVLSEATESDYEERNSDSTSEDTAQLTNVEGINSVVESPINNAPKSGESTHHMVTRSKSKLVNQALITSTSSSVYEPTTLTEALQHPHWITAMNEELNALFENGTWILVPRRSDMHVIGSKWVYKTKLLPNGKIERFKARLVAKGYNQVQGVDFSETFSPVIRHATVKLVLSLAIVHKWTIKQLDVKNAFLHGVLTDTVFMEQPPGFSNPSYPNHVCKLKKAIYGLKQAPRAWFNKFSDYLLSIGFFCSMADPSLFVLHSDKGTILLLLYVDDIIITGNNTSLLNSVILQLSCEFAMKDLGRLHYFLGIEVLYFEEGILLTQKKYAADLLKKTKLLYSKSVSTPLVPKHDLHASEVTFVDPKEYRCIVGALQYLTLTRPDIAHSVNLVCQFMQAPTLKHLQAVKRILRYIKGTLDYGLRILSQSSLTLYGFSDADWAGCSITRRSTSGFCIYLGSNCISWSSRKQPTVARSSAEAEYRSLASAAAELTWLTYILRDVGVSLYTPPVLYCDNLSALYMTVNPILHARTKHIELDYHFVREKVAKGALITKFVCSFDQIADIFTKGLSNSHFMLLRSKLGVSTAPSSLRGSVKESQQNQGQINTKIRISS